MKKANLMIFSQTSNEKVGRTLSDVLTAYYNDFLAAVPKIALGIAIVTIGFLIARFIGKFTTKQVRLRTEDPLMSKFLGNAMRTVLVIVFIMIALRAAGLGDISAGILATAGASAVVLGFAFKDIGENFIAGVILSFNRPFNVDDTVEIGSNFGRVKALEFRYTKLKTFDGKDVYIPNSDVITQPVTNYTEDGFYRMDFTVGLDYNDDIDAAKELIMQALDADEKVVKNNTHVNYVMEESLATSTVNLKIFFWIDTHEFGHVANRTKGRVIGKVKQELMAAGYYLPADIQEIKLYGKEVDIPLSFKDNRTDKL